MQDRWILLLLLTALAWACSPREQVQGTARVVDGDSLEIAGTSIRLFGVDAPEGRQTCTRNGRIWRCGDAAAERLEQLVGNDTIVCTQRDTDTYGRMVAVCVNGEIDLSAELALSGLALAYREYSYDYVDEEAEALAARRGLWSGEFQAPWDWRLNPEPVATPPVAGFPISVSF